MYIKSNGVQYPCDFYVPLSGVRAVFGGVERLPLPVTGTITLCSNDGFELASVSAESYARQVYENVILTLTNEPEPDPDPPPPIPTVEERLEILTETMDIILTEIIPSLTGG